MLAAALLALPIPLLPIQLLWINLVTDGLPALALVMDPPDDDVLRQPPRRLDEAMLGGRQWKEIVAIGMLEATLVLAVFAWLLQRGGVDEARTMAFTVLVFCEVLRAFAARSRGSILWEIGAFSNARLAAVVAVTVLLQLALSWLPGPARLFRMVGLSLLDCAAALTIGLVPVTVLEVSKLIRRSRLARS
jgi:Ca2+-transporting ATPase